MSKKPLVRARRPWFVAALAAALACAGCGRGPSSPGNPGQGTPPPMGDGTPLISIDATTRFQTITGWEATAQAGQDLSPAYPAYKNTLLDAAVDDLGLDRLRVEIRSGVEYSSDPYAALLAGQITREQWRPIRYATVNDNDDPFALNERGFWFTELDNEIEKVVLPMKERLEARGRRLFVNICYVAFTGQITDGQYHHKDPEEYAEFVQATFQHLSRKYGLVPDAWELILEPDNTREWTASYLRQAMIATGNRLTAMGLSPGLIAPSTTNMSTAVTFADEIARGGLPRLWSTLSYHRYDGVSDAALQGIASRARQWGLQTAMLEHIGSGYENLHQDLKVGNNSAWQQFILTVPDEPGDGGGMYYLVDASNPMAPRLSAASRTPALAQYFRYIRSGAVRVAATSSDAAFDPVGFVNPDGTFVVVVKATRGGAFALQGLAAGTYEVTYTTGSERRVRVGTMPVGATDTMRLSIPDRGAITISGT